MSIKTYGDLVLSMSILVSDEGNRIGKSYAVDDR
jgi:hypothetical protein